MEDAKNNDKPTRRRRRLLSPSARGRKGGRVGGKATVPKGFAKLPHDVVVERARQAGKASAEARRKRKAEQQLKEGQNVQQD